jgi:hypothetical protein
MQEFAYYRRISNMARPQSDLLVWSCSKYHCDRKMGRRRIALHSHRSHRLHLSQIRAIDTTPTSTEILRLTQGEGDRVERSYLRDAPLLDSDPVDRESGKPCLFLGCCSRDDMMLAIWSIWGERVSLDAQECSDTRYQCSCSRHNHERPRRTIVVRLDRIYAHSSWSVLWDLLNQRFSERYSSLSSPLVGVLSIR